MISVNNIVMQTDSVQAAYHQIRLRNYLDFPWGN